MIGDRDRKACGIGLQYWLGGIDLDGNNATWRCLHWGRFAVASPTVLERNRRFQNRLAPSYLLKYVVPRHPPRRHRSIGLRTQENVRILRFQLYIFPCVASSHKTFVKKKRWSWGGAIVESVIVDIFEWQYTEWLLIEEIAARNGVGARGTAPGGGIWAGHVNVILPHFPS